MRAILLPCVAFLSLALSGCKVVYNAHPLYTSDDAVEVPALEGVWTNVDSESDKVCIRKSDHHQYQLISFDPPSKVTDLYQINLVRLDDQLFADMVFQKEFVDGTEIDPPVGATFYHAIAKLEITDNELSYAALDYYAVRDENKETFPPLEFLDDGGMLLVTSSTTDMRQYLKLYADRVFDSTEHLRKIEDGTGASSSTPCTIPTAP